MLRKALILLLPFLLFACVDIGRDTLTIELDPSIDTLEVNSNYNVPTATALLNGEPHAVDIIKNTVDITEIGSYVIVYETSFADKTKTLKRHTEVVDEIPPQVTLNPGVDTVLQGTTWEDAGVQATDNSALPVEITVEGNVDTTVPGDYIITYTATDHAGNQSTIIRYVSVIAR